MMQEVGLQVKQMMPQLPSKIADREKSPKEKTPRVVAQLSVMRN
jgi:hypothetical protein